MKRASRVPLMGTADVQGEATTFSPNSEEWQVIGGVYCDLDANDRRAIAAIVDSYLFWKLPEETARPRSDLLDHFDAIARAARELSTAIAPNADTVRNVALSELLDRLPADIGRAIGTPIDKLSHAQLSAIIWSIADAATLAKRDACAPNLRGFERHSAWRQMAWELMDWAQHKALRVSTAKKSNTVRNWPSPFVKFFDRLQSKFPSDMREFVQGPDSLTDALDDVRRKRAARKKGNSKPKAAPIIP